MLRYGIFYSPPSRQYDAGDAQVRILTVDNESVVRETVRNLPDSFDKPYVIAEELIEIPGAEVRVVPADFESDATNKARAVEWARQSIPSKREFTLYLDEDSHMLEFGGFPDADIIQFNEFPRKTSSLLTYFCEINRIGFQIEQTSFPRVKIPLYAWGGGIAIRKSVEDEITWDYPTVIEDTVFMWRAFTELDREVSFAYIPDRISNQAPPNFWEMFQQRRRWIAGSREDFQILSVDRILMYGIRDLSWSATGVIPVLAVIGLLPGIDIFFAEMYLVTSLVLLGFMYIWIIIGLLRYRPSIPIAIAVLILAPLTTILHSFGALWGIISPPDTFEITAKVDDNSQEDEFSTPASSEDPTQNSYD
ncbi:glycosyltransferase [Halodesulfurarchaeum sp.]|uniref:glycosyltransferase n=1 Tax=Halodesulfurarchaeum sp. TaxID=1980530 RepID=UPI002FC329AD